MQTALAHGEQTERTIASSDPWLSLEEAATHARCHVSTLRRLIKAGILRHARVGPSRKAIRVRRSWIDAALEASVTPVEVAETGAAR